ncbi:MAG: 4Fe-4S binding protein [Polyangiaceae bacterium]
MRQFTDAVRALGVTLKNMFRPAVTEGYPKVKRERKERYRTSFALLHDEQGEELCIGCLQCERICPSRIIQIKQAAKRESKVTGKKRGYADDFTLDLNACIYCELCVQVCPTDAIVMVKEPEPPTFSREDLVLTMERLYENEKRPHSWANGSKLMAMQEPPKDPKKEKAAPAKADGAKADGAAAAAEAKPAKAPKADKAEAPKAEAPKADKAETPKAEAPKADKAETPKAEAPKADKAETPKAEAAPAEKGES